MYLPKITTTSSLSRRRCRLVATTASSLSEKKCYSSSSQCHNNNTNCVASHPKRRLLALVPQQQRQRQQPHVYSRHLSHTPTTTTSSGSGSGSDNGDYVPGILRNLWRTLTLEDDSTGFLRVLERKDMYSLLVILRLRRLRMSLLEKKLRLDDGTILPKKKEEDENQTSSHYYYYDNQIIQPPIPLTKDIIQTVIPTTNELVDQSFNELEKENLDEFSNIQLRLEIQDIMGPQVISILQTIHSVDTEIRNHHNPKLIESDGIPQYDPTTGTFDYGDHVRETLIQDYETTSQELSRVSKKVYTMQKHANMEYYTNEEKKTIQSMQFLKIKQGALRTILLYHDWLPSTDRHHSSLVQQEKQTNTNDTGVDDFGFDYHNADSETLQAMRHYQTINLYRSYLIKERLGYSVLSLKSSIPQAGRGVYIDGTCINGSLVSFQPGDVWPLGSIQNQSQMTGGDDSYFNDNSNQQISLRYDHVIIDSRTSPYTVLNRYGTQMNPFALGHIMNHPPKNTLPNCSSVLFNFTDTMNLGFADATTDNSTPTSTSPPSSALEENTSSKNAAKDNKSLRMYIPNEYAVPPTWLSRSFDRYVIEMHSMLLVTKRDCSNEELYYDYRLLAENTNLPDWYHKVQYNDWLDDEK